MEELPIWRVNAQPRPKGASGVDVANLVHDDLEARIKRGEATYGERLAAFNGRDPLVDLYEELLDAVLYLRQLLWEKYHG